jgi:hypothetical protein
LRSKAQRTGKGGYIMNVRLLKHLKKYAVAYLLLISAFIVTSAQAAKIEELFLFRSPGATIPAWNGDASIIQQKILKLDEKGDLLIQCGCARFLVAYNEPSDQFKPPEQLQNPQRRHTSPINGISLTASLSF